MDQIHSIEKLQNVHSDLIKLVYKISEKIPLIIVNGYRNEKDQTDAYHSGHSKLQWPNSMHNKMPSLAIDLSPYPYTENSLDLCYFAGIVMKTAEDLLVSKIRWGGDWNQNLKVSDERFRDLYHFELLINISEDPKVMPI